MDGDKKQFYSVHPKTVIQIGKRAFRRPISIDLTKEEVLTLMKKCAIYRRFSQTHLEKVTTLNIDRLHNDKFMDEKEYEQFLSEKASENAGTVKQEEVEPEVETTTEEVNDTPDEEPVQEEVVELESEETSVEEEKEETVVESVPEQEQKEQYEKPIINTGSNKKNKKRHN